MSTVVLALVQDPALLAPLRELCETDHRSLILAPDGRPDVLQRLPPVIPGVAVLDLDIPGARALGAALRERPADNPLPLVYLAGNEHEDVRELLLAGETDVIHKPVAPPVLRAKLDVLLRRISETETFASGPDDAAGSLAKAPIEVQGYASDPARRFDKYILGERLGGGASGQIWKAWDANLAVWVALKFVREQVDRVQIERLFREAQAAARLDHPSICRVYDVRTVGARHFIAMEFVDGEVVDGPIPGARAARLARDVALAVDHAHRHGVVHRDIKPENILVGADDHPYVMDFGISRIQESATLTPLGMVVGSPSFMPPEVVAGQRADARSDIYSIGATLYSWLCGSAPYEDQGFSVTQLLSAISRGDLTPIESLLPVPAHPALLEALGCALAREPGDRPDSASALAGALDASLQAMGGSAT